MPVSVISTGHLSRPEVRIGHVTISRNSSWIHLDSCLRGLVKTYLDSLDPEHSLELNSQSMVCYQCGNIRWELCLSLSLSLFLSKYSSTDECSKAPSQSGDPAYCRTRGSGSLSTEELTGVAWRISPSPVCWPGLAWPSGCGLSVNISEPSFWVPRPAAKLSSPPSWPSIWC